MVQDEGQNDADKGVAEEGQHPEEDALEENADDLQQHDHSEADKDLVGLGYDVWVPGVQFNRLKILDANPGQVLGKVHH